MRDSDSRIVRAERFAKIWWQSRADAGKSQEYLALGLGVSKKTIQNWEKGLSSPSFFQAEEWFHLLCLNPAKYYIEFLYPNLSESLTGENEADLDEILIKLIKNLSIAEKKELIYLMSCAHGSSWHAVLQLFTMHCQTSLQSRATAARTILENYEIEEKSGKLVNRDAVKPDVKLLKSALQQCKIAAQNNCFSYVPIVCAEDKAFSASEENKN